MAITAKIFVVQKRRHWSVAAMHHLLFWGILIGAIAISRNWLGGSFIVEVLAAIFAFVILAQLVAKSGDKEVEMDPNELRLWLADGAPKDVADWRSVRKRVYDSPTQDNAR